MRLSVFRPKRAASFEELKPACQILILHEDFPAYSRAVELCRRIMARFADELDFDIKCWSLIELADPNSARHAAKTAGAADVILLSVQRTRLPPEFDRWLDAFFIARFKDDGLLALVLNQPSRPLLEIAELCARLKQLAERRDMDFISMSPVAEASTIPVPATTMAQSDMLPVA